MVTSNAPTLISKAVILAAIALVTQACGKGECTKFGGCPTVDVNEDADAVVISLDSSTAFVTVDADPSEAWALLGGQVILAPSERDCVASSDHPCHATLRRLKLEVSAFTQRFSDDSTLSVDEPVVSLVAPVELDDTGSGFVISADHRFQTCALVDGRRQSDMAKSNEPTTLMFDETSRSMSISSSFVLIVHGDSDKCAAVPYSMHLIASGHW
jgi:hypothetical protein